MCSCAMMAQEVNLVNDYIPGPGGVCSRGVYQYQNSLVFYKELDEETKIYQYDKDSDQISVILTSDNVEDDLLGLATNGIETAISSGTNGLRQHAYISENRDFSDLTKIFSVENTDSYISRSRYYDGYYIFFTSKTVDSLSLIDVYLVDDFGETSIIVSDLPDGSYDYNYGKVDNYLIIAPERTAINGKNIFAFDMDEKMEVPIDEVIPTYQDCGLNRRFFILNENIMVHECESQSYLYDIANEKYLDYNLVGYPFLLHDSPEHLHYVAQSTLFRLDKSTGESSIIVEEVWDQQIRDNKIAVSIKVGDFIQMVFYDVITGETDIHPTNFPSQEFFLGFSRMYAVESGYHFTLYAFGQEEAMLCRINEEEFKVIDEFSGLSFRSTPAVYGEDVYFTKNDPEYGPELFVVNYTPSSANDIENSFDLSIAPNPAQSHISLLTTEHIERIEISNMSGQSIKTEQYNNSSIDISDMAPGIYILKAINRDGLVATQKLIVTK